jgi:hypothetical protein
MAWHGMALCSLTPEGARGGRRAMVERIGGSTNTTEAPCKGSDQELSKQAKVSAFRWWMATVASSHLHNRRLLDLGTGGAQCWSFSETGCPRPGSSSQCSQCAMILPSMVHITYSRDLHIHCRMPVQDCLGTGQRWGIW